jgi:hypothetical protein
MRTPSAAPLATAARLPRALLLVLALCACGGGDDPERRADARDPATNVALQDSAAPSCTPPPAIDTTLFNGTWAELGRHLKERGARFPMTKLNSSTSEVRLCDSCAVANLTLHADAATHCTTPEQMNGETRVMAIFVLASDFKGDPRNGWEPIARGDSIYAFARDTFGAATLVYRGSDGRVVRAPDHQWAFLYCKGDHVPGDTLLALWRDRGPPPTTTQLERDKGKAKGREEEDENGQYGWMACASGCCQFYTPPPNQTSQNEDGRGRRGTGGQRQAAGDSIPYWCHRRT